MCVNMHVLAVFIESKLNFEHTFPRFILELTSLWEKYFYPIRISQVFLRQGFAEP